MHVLTTSKAKIFLPFLLCLCITAAYIPTFSGEFFLDDNPLVKNNIAIREYAAPMSYLSHEDGVSDEGLSGYHTGYYRPLISLSYALDYKIWGLNPSGFRTTNLILHLLVCIILYYFLATLLGGSVIPFAVALLFGLHPANTESVSWIAARNNILVTLFSLISFYYYLKYNAEKKAWAGLLSYLSFLAGLMCKEFAVMLLPIFFLYNRFIANDRRAVKAEIWGYLPFILILFFYFALRTAVIGTAITPISNPDLWKGIYFAPFWVMYNLRLILAPFSLHSFIIHYPDYLGWEAPAGFLAIGFCTLLLWKQRKNKIILFSFLSFLIALFPVLNILPTSAVTKISMRWLYFPMIYISFLSVWYLQKLLNVNRFITLSLLTTALVYFGSYSYLLNKNLWHDEQTFFAQEVDTFNNYFYAGGLAESLLDRGNFREAEGYFRIAIKNYPDARNYINYSALLIDTGRPDEALFCLNKAKALSMTYKERGEWFNNRGMAHFNLRNNGEALKNFKKAIIFGPKESQFRANLGGAYGSMGEYQKSVDVLNQGLKIMPESIRLRENLEVTYRRMREYKKAILALEVVPAEMRERNRRVEKLLKEARKGFPKED